MNDDDAADMGARALWFSDRWRVVHRWASAAVLLAVAIPASVFAQATPAPFPTAPDPAECVVAPRPLEEVIVVVGTPVAAPETASPTPFVPPAGEPADAETASAVVATLRQVFACTNAGDYRRVFALFSDAFLRDFFAGTPITPEVTALLAATPQPLPVEQQRVIVRIGEVQRLADGRAGVVIVLDEPDDPRTEEPDYAILTRIDGRWLVDEIHEDGGATPGTPMP